MHIIQQGGRIWQLQPIYIALIGMQMVEISTGSELKRRFTAGGHDWWLPADVLDKFSQYEMFCPRGDLFFKLPENIFIPQMVYKICLFDAFLTFVNYTKQLNSSTDLELYSTVHPRREMIRGSNLYAQDNQHIESCIYLQGYWCCYFSSKVLLRLSW